MLPKVAKAKRPNGNEGGKGRRGIHPIILTCKKVAENKMDCGEKGGRSRGQYLDDVQFGRGQNVALICECEKGGGQELNYVC